MLIQTAIVSASSLDELNLIVEKAKEGITFWGFRYIYAAGYDERTPIDALAIKVMRLYTSVKMKEGTLEETLDRTSKFKAHPFLDKVNKLYSDNDKRLKNTNYLTQIFCQLRYVWDRLTSNQCLNAREKWDFFKDALI